MSASLNAILSLARSGLLTQQLALQVASHNLANATTEGFSRQRAELVPSTPVLLPEGLLGTGVRVADITRARDALLDGVYWRESAGFHGLSSRHEALAQVEAALAEPSQLSLGASLSAFWNAWSDLATDPVSSSARVAVVAAGQRLADHFHRVAASLDGLQNTSVERLDRSVRRVNDLLAQIAAVNGQIVSVRAAGTSAPDLEDRRDLLLDELATFAPIQVTPRDTGAVGVSIEGVSVVEGTRAQTLALQAAGGAWTLQTGTGLGIGATSGSIGGLLTVLNGDLPRLRADLDQLAQGLVERVNGIHVTGTNAAGATGTRFFDDFGAIASVTAANLSLDAAIAADAQAVAAGTPDGSGNYRSGANDVALALAGLRTASAGGILAGRSVDDAYRDFAATVAADVGAARSASDVHASLLQAARERRESVSGVATDEELVKVIQIQAAYAAAARLVNVADEMYQSLLAI